MARENRTAAHALNLARELEEKPYEFDFFHALRRLECAHPEKPRIGLSRRPADDPVRLAQEPSLAFAPSTLHSYGPGRNGGAARLSVLFFGLFGPNGPLPLHLTDYTRDRVRNADDLTFARFADVFHHRLLSLFYRAWASTHPAVNFDRPEADRFLLYVGSLFGLGMPSLHNRDAMPDLAKFHFAGRLGCQTHNAEGLHAILGDLFGMPVRIEQFVGHWMRLPENGICRLGESPQTGALGKSTVIGSRVWERQYKFRIDLGPMKLADYVCLLPKGDNLAFLAAVVRNYLGDELLWDVNLILKKEEVPPLKLGVMGRLGWTSWLPVPEIKEDLGDLTINPCDMVA